MENKKFMIKQLADVFGISRNVIRKYEELGLIQPASYGDDFNERLYTSDHIEQIRWILSLKTMGFSLEQIKLFFDGKLDFKSKSIELYDRFIILESFIHLYTKEPNKNYESKIKTMPSHYVISEELEVEKWQDIIPAFSVLSDKIIDNKLKEPLSSTPYVLFDTLNFQLTNFSCTLNIIVEKSFKECVKEIPETKYLTCLHYGDYEELKNAYDFLENYAQNNNIKIIGKSMERYIVGYSNNQLSSTFITEVCLPIE